MTHQNLLYSNIFIMVWKKKFFLLLSFFNYKMCLFGIFIERKKNCLPIHLKNCNIIIAMYRFDLLESGQNFRPNKMSSSKCFNLSLVIKPVNIPLN